MNRNHNQVRNSRRGGFNGPRIKPTLFMTSPLRKRTPKKPAKKPAKTPERRRCDRCKKRFMQACLFVHHKPWGVTRKPQMDFTEHMPSNEFDRVYRRKSKRPYYDRRKNIMIVCQSCYDDCVSCEMPHPSDSSEERDA
jgi:hypothetical protein